MDLGRGGDAVKTVIYLDVLLLVNFLIAYFLLLAAGMLTGQQASFRRMLLGSVLASGSALILFAPELSYPAQVAYKLVAAGAIVGACYGMRRVRKFLSAVFWYAALNILLAGLAILAILRTGTPMIQTGNLTVYLRLPPVLLLLLSALCCLAVWVYLYFAGGTPRKTPTIGVEFELCGSMVRLRAMLDTGCHLKDPVTCLPVLVISWPGARGRLPEPVDRYLRDWFDGRRPDRPPEQTSLRLIPCATAARNTLLPGFAVDNIGLITEHGVVELGHSAVAFSPQEFNSAEYEALYGPDFL